MAHKKFSAQHIFNGYEILNGDYVLITDEAGIIQEIIAAKDAGDNVQFFNGLLSPGFINCHCHLELSHMKGLIPEKTGLVDFVFKVVTERHFSEDEIEDAIAKGENEMLANGIVAVGDICNNLSTLPQKLKQLIAYYNFIEVTGWLPQVAQTRFEKGKLLYDAFAKNFERKTSIVPHAPYSVSQQLWKLINPCFEEKTITIHNQETSCEDDLFKTNEGDFLRMYKMMNIANNDFVPTGKSSLQSCFSEMNNAKNILLVHNTFTKEEDVLFIKKQSSGSYFCICINANLYIENEVPPVNMFLKNNCKIVLGTDSLASNHSLNLLDEIKSIGKHFPEISLQQLLQFATINGANALQMNNRFGSFEKGKQPGILLIDKIENENITADSFVKRLL